MGQVHVSQEFLALIERLERIHGSKKEAAAAIGIQPPRYSKVRNGSDRYRLNVRNCFRLAKAVNERPQAVLRSVGKNDLADALDEFYGTKTGEPQVSFDWLENVSIRDVEVVARSMRQLPEHAQSALAQVAEAMVTLQQRLPRAIPASESVPGSAPKGHTKSAPKRRR